MSDKTGIAWCDSTFNPWIGCSKVGPGCDNCYAEADFDLRRKKVKWGPGNPRNRTSIAYWKKPLQWNAKQFYECQACGMRGDSRAMLIKQEICDHPIQAREIVRRRIFCASLSDVFDNKVPQEWRIDLLRLIAITPNLDWLLLTKRIGNAHRMMVEAFSAGWPRHGDTWERWPELFRNIWLGATICNQEEADRDIPKLLAVPARVRFLSMEPLLGPVDLTRLNTGGILTMNAISSLNGRYNGIRSPSTIDWVVVGGESGANSRPMQLDWARALRDQCAETGIAFFFKQNGGGHADKGGCRIDGIEIKQWPGQDTIWNRQSVRVALHQNRDARDRQCLWTRDEDDGSWDTACGNKFCIDEGTPEENRMRFCCYCGAELATPNVQVEGAEGCLQPQAPARTGG